MKNKIIYRK